MLIFEIIQSY